MTNVLHFLREKDTESNADLEEGEIEDDEEEQQVEEKPPASGKEAGANETGNKEDVARPVAESTDNKPGEKQRDRRQPTNNLSNSAATRSKRSRAASHERDLQVLSVEGLLLPNGANSTLYLLRGREGRRSKTIRSGTTRGPRLGERRLRDRIIANRAEATWMTAWYPVLRDGGPRTTGDRAQAGAAPAVAGEAAAAREATEDATDPIGTVARPRPRVRRQRASKTTRFAPSSWKASAQEAATVRTRTPLSPLAKWSCASST